MDVIISGRHLEIDGSIRTYVQEKLTKIESEFPKLITARVVVDSERNWRVVEIELHGKHLTLVAKAKSPDVFVSIDDAVKKLEKQLRKHLERLQEHRTNGKGLNGDSVSDSERDSDAE